MTATVIKLVRCEVCGTEAELIELDDDSLHALVLAWHDEHRDCDSTTAVCERPRRSRRE